MLFSVELYINLAKYLRRKWRRPTSAKLSDFGHGKVSGKWERKEAKEKYPRANIVDEEQKTITAKNQSLFLP